MRCKFIVDVGINPASLDVGQKDKVRFRDINGGRNVEAYFPAGTEYENVNAAFFVNRGMALPADAECELASKPLTASQRNRLEAGYRADAAGIHDNGDRELFFAGVITGYKTVDGKKVYIPGPQWANYQQAKAAEETDEDDA